MTPCQFHTKLYFQPLANQKRKMLKGEKKKVNLENRSLEKESFADIRGRFRTK